MDFGFNQEQELLRATARKFFESECTSEFVRARMAEPAGVTDAFWAKLAEQGWLGLIYPEEYGGAGLGFVDLTVLMEEMGRAVMPGPFFASAAMRGSSAKGGSAPRAADVTTAATTAAATTARNAVNMARSGMAREHSKPCAGGRAPCRAKLGTWSLPRTLRPPRRGR